MKPYIEYCGSPICLDSIVYLQKLIEKARLHRQEFPMTEEEERAQIISFAYGNCAVKNPNITREMVECEYDRLYEAERREGE